MLNINEIAQQYPDNVQKFDKDLIREYLQYIILAIIYSHEIGSNLSFLGGTNLRIVHGLPRFSEDIDFDNKHLSLDEFHQLSSFVKMELEKLGYIVEIRLTQQQAFHCYIKFPELLYTQGITPVESEKIIIRIDTFDQGVFYTPEVYLLDKFNLFKQILITPKDIILSQKLWTITQRSRAKGRDYYDIMFLLQTTRPNMQFLEAKFNTSYLAEIITVIDDVLQKIDMTDLAKDVQPFLIGGNAFELLSNFQIFLHQKLA